MRADVAGWHDQDQAAAVWDSVICVGASANHTRNRPEARCHAFGDTLSSAHQGIEGAVRLSELLLRETC